VLGAGVIRRKHVATEWAVAAFDVEKNVEILEPVSDEVTARWLVQFRAENGSTWARNSRVVRRTVTPWEDVK
jgi:hypothetical protein